MSDERGLGRVLVVDGQPVMRAGLEAILGAEEGLEVCGHAGNPREGVACIADLAPDLVVTEVSFPGGVRLDFLKDLRARYPDLPVLVFSSMPEAVYAGRARRSGALGWVSKSEEADRIRKAVRRVLAGEPWPAGPPTPRRGHAKASETTLSPVDTLSDRELQVYELIGQGLGTSQIARTLHLSIKTIESHKANLKRKLSLPSSSELQIQAVEWSRGSAKDPLRAVGEDPHLRPPYAPEERRVAYCLLTSPGGDPVLLDPVEPLTIGRGGASNVRLNSTLVSREQARVYWDAARGFVLQDLGSRNGTFVNGHLLQSECLLRAGDTIQLANVSLTFASSRRDGEESGIEEEVTRTWGL